MADKDPAISFSFKFPGVKLMEFWEKTALKTPRYLNDIGAEGTEPLMSPTVPWCLQKLIKEPLLSVCACSCWSWIGFNFYL